VQSMKAKACAPLKASLVLDGIPKMVAWKICGRMASLHKLLVALVEVAKWITSQEFGKSFEVIVQSKGVAF